MRECGRGYVEYRVKVRGKGRGQGRVRVGDMDEEKKGIRTSSSSGVQT